MWSSQILILVLIPLSVLLAASVGPSSAIALISRLSQIPADSTSLWLNVTEIDIYPDMLDSDNVPDGCDSPPNYSILGNDCPYSEWLAVATMLNDYPGYTGSRWNTLQNEDTTRQLYLDVTADRASIASTLRRNRRQLLKLSRMWWIHGRV